MTAGIVAVVLAAIAGLGAWLRSKWLGEGRKQGAAAAQKQAGAAATVVTGAIATEDKAAAGEAAAGHSAVSGQLEADLARPRTGADMDADLDALEAAQRGEPR